MRALLIFAIFCACACSKCGTEPSQGSDVDGDVVEAGSAPELPADVSPVDAADAVSPADAASDTTAS